MTPAQEQILALVSGLPSRIRYGRLLCMLQAFFDGSTESGEALIFAGYIAPVESWLSFTDDWSELLTLPPRLGAFKMKTVVRMVGGMERARLHYGAIQRAKLAGIVRAIPIQPLKRVVRELNVDPFWENPYYLAWRVAITAAIEGANKLGSSEPIEFIFDDQTDKKQLRRAWDDYYESAPRSYRKRIKNEPLFRKDDDLKPLQAADLIAWWARKQYIVDQSRMRDMFPDSWTGGKSPDLFAVTLPEEAIRVQFLKDIETARRKQSEFRLRATFRYPPPSSGGRSS